MKDTADQLRNSENNVLIETLLAGSLGLPQTPSPVLDGLCDFLPSFLSLSDIKLTFFVPSAVPVLHPSILILTKLKRWATTAESTRPKTKEKNPTDAADIEWMILWLANNDLKIRFEQYAGKTKEGLLPLIRKYRDKFAGKDNLMVALKAVLGDDWDLLHADVPSHPHDGDITS